MSNYPPKLLEVSEADCGSVLRLEDGGQVAVDVRPARLKEAILQYGLPSLEDLIAARTLGVFVGMPHMTTEQWDRIRECIRSSPVATGVLSSVPPLWASFREPYAVVVGRPHRVYGGLSEWALYTSLPIDFGTDPNRPPSRGVARCSVLLAVGSLTRGCIWKRERRRSRQNSTPAILSSKTSGEPSATRDVGRLTV
jgi:hypothetical protein